MNETTSEAPADVIHHKQRIMQNFLLIWLRADIDYSSQEQQNILVELRSIANEVSVFTQSDECIDYVTDIVDIKVILIIDDTLGEQILPLIHDISQLSAVYIFCHQTSNHEQWTAGWKVKGIGTEMASICESLEKIVQQINQNSIAVSFVEVNVETDRPNLNQLEPSFMYTQLFKEILLKLEYNEESMKNFITYCRNNNYGSSTFIPRFENEYNPQTAVWWYTDTSSIYDLLNCALRKLEVDTIINMGFFIRDLHYQIKEQHQKQFMDYKGKTLVLYRGQGLSTADFDRLRRTKAGLISFNNFLSTSEDRDVSWEFAIIASTIPGTIGIIFQMSIDPSSSSTPFAAIKDLSKHKSEEEYLFCMHSIFRIGEIKQLENNDSLYQVDLQLTSDEDPQLRILTEHIQKETEHYTGWTRLGALLVKTGNFNKAEDLFNTLLEQSSDVNEKAAHSMNLGCLKVNQGDYKKAISYYDKSLEIYKKTLPLDHRSLAICYGNIGVVYTYMGRCSKALAFYEKGLEIFEKLLALDHPDLATFYNNISTVHENMGQYPKALVFHEKALEVRKKTLPANHPDLATSYNNIGLVHKIMGMYSKALLFYEKALDIRQKTLPQNHPDLANSYDNIGGLYAGMGKYSQALSFYKKALQILEKTVSTNHPSLAISYNNIGEVYKNMGESSTALSFYQKGLEIRQEVLPLDHHDLATSYNNIGAAYDDMGEYSKALSNFENALKIRHKRLLANHSDFAQSYNNLAAVYHKMGQNSKALSYYEKSLEIAQKSLSPDHPHLATVYNNIAVVYMNMSDFSKALLFHKKALEIRHKILPPNHPDFVQSFNNIASIYANMREYSKAIQYFERALNILQFSCPGNHPIGAVVQENIEFLKRKM